MPSKQYTGKKRFYILDSELASGGEGKIFSIVGDPGSVAKLYSEPTKELESKLLYMSKNPPDESVLNDLAWPVDVIYDEQDNFVGFVMPKLIVDSELRNLYQYTPGQKSLLSYENKIIIAINLCKVITAVHNAGYVFGDFNPSNIGVNLINGHVAFFDADSYHVLDKDTGTLYRCCVGYDGYIAPELIKRAKGYTYAECPLPTFTKETDRFALAIHIFRLLFNGYTPFNGIKENSRASTASPGVGTQAVEKDSYCFKPGNKPLSAGTPDLDAFPEYLSSLFQKAFIDGRENPELRPTADEWCSALLKYKDEVVRCQTDPNHFYYKDKKINAIICPYCAAERRALAAQNQVNFKSPVVVPTSGVNLGHKRKKTFTFKFKPFVIAFLSIAGVVGIILAIVFGTRSCSSTASGQYSSSNFVYKMTSKKSIKQDSYYYYVESDISITNNGKKDAESIYGTLFFQNSYYTDLIGFNVSYSGLLKAGTTNNYVTEFKAPISEEKAKVVYSTSFTDLAVIFKITDIQFSDGTYKSYDNEYEYIKRPGETGKDDNINTLEEVKKASLGSKVRFGKYELDKDFLNGEEYISWTVKSKANNKVLLLCDVSLIGMPYSSNNSYTSWENSLVRKYLNGTFISKHLSSAEASVLAKTECPVTDKEKEYGANQTSDYVYIPTMQDIEGYFPDSQDRKCECTGNLWGETTDDVSSIENDTGYYTGYWLRDTYYDEKEDKIYQSEFVYNLYYENPMFAFEDNYDSWWWVRPMLSIDISKI